MKSASRGTAMIETAIVLTMVLVILYGTMQIAIWGYSQATSEGAAFIGAHAASINSSGSQSTDQTYGLSVANVAFPKIGGSGPFTFLLTYPTGQTNAIQAIVTSDAVGGLLMLPNAKQNIEVRGGDIEPILASISNKGSTNGGFGAQATLMNYCFFKTTGKTTSSLCPIAGRAIYIAQYDDIYGKGNGKNGQFAEWNCRPTLFATWGGSGTLSFPTTYPTYGTSTGGGPNSIYDPASPTFFEAGLYAFDTQTNQWGIQSSC
jgi:TadE-like protein